MMISGSKDTACFGVSCFLMTLFSDYEDVEKVPAQDIAMLQGMYIAIGAMMIGEQHPDHTAITKFEDLHKLGQDTIYDFIHRDGMYEAVQDNIFKVPNYVPDDL